MREAGRAHAGLRGLFANGCGDRAGRPGGQSVPGIPGRLAGTRRRVAATAVVGAVFLAVAACQGGSAKTSGAEHAVRQRPSRPAAKLSITPADGSRGVKTSAAVTVTATNAKVISIAVTAGGAPVEGSVSEAGTVWRSRWPLRTSRIYKVTATGRSPAGAAVTATSSFRTMTPSTTLGAQIFEGYRQTYGVGMPIIINFSRPVTGKAAVEKSIELKTSKPVVGAWYWDGDQTLYFRPRAYWPQNTRVSFAGHFDGVRAAPGVYGTADLTQEFTIGASLIVTLSTRTHYMKVWYRGKLFANWPISTGMPGYDTANGTYLTIEKGNPTRMVGNGYNVLVPYAVRFTWSGNYIHDAWWSVAQQGHVNVSHGCVNVSPARSKIYYRLARPGDPVTVTGSPVAGKWGDGWTVWFWTWRQLVRGSALNKAVLAGPGGSRLVSPSSLGPSPRSSTLQGPKPGNSLAQ